jgi:aminoglycoside phosphotransferase (APT) family kinase protein
MSVTLNAHTVLKRPAPARLLREFAKTQAAYALACESQAFRAPRPLAASAESGTLLLERLHDFTPLRAALAAMSLTEQIETLARVARLLLLVHERLPLPREWLDDRIPDQQSQALPARLHGDFTLDNLMFSRGSAQIAILDWSMPAWLDYDACIGPAAIDLVGMLISLFNQRVVQRRKLHEPEQLATVFLDAYAQGSPRAAQLQLAEVFAQNEAQYAVSLRRTAGWQLPLYASHQRRLRDYAAGGFLATRQRPPQVSGQVDLR